ncbi:oligopeptide ABC transporter permease OppB [Inquilinus sp. CAU 1745]|uniref:oligopeptide ABC transporter permease OppB n=1 Tax=Inquilinus sp. CAU 1745 TaxID=3140369 RepID=UPI00325BA423
MLSYSVRRVLGAIPTLLIIITITFFMVRLAPGGPFSAERRVPPQIEENLRAAYNLDDPLILQYLNYLADVLRGDLGPSFKYLDFSVNQLIAQGFPVSMQLGGTAILLAVLIGTTLGSIAALKQNSSADFGVMSLAMVGITIPNFVVAPLLVMLFAVQLGWLPAGGWGSGAWEYKILPIVALTLPQVAYVARMTRASMIEVLRSNFIRTARAKGLPERVMIVRHTLKGALLPVVSYLGPATAAIITGSVVIEQIFGMPGIGRYFVQAALNRDYTLVMGVVIFYGALIIGFNLLVDLVYGLLDPRVRYD